MKRDKICGVYKFTHIPSGKCYVGSSIDCLKRRDSHIKCALSGHRNYFKKSMRELGVENFNFEIIEICEPGKRLLREKFHIASSCSAFPSGFNLVEDPTIGPNYIFSEGVRLKMSLGRLGKPMPESAKEKISKSLIGNTRTLGRKLSTEHIEKIRAKNKGIKRSREFCEAVRVRMLKFKHSEDSKLKMSISSLGRLHTIETRLKMSISKIGNKNNPGTNAKGCKWSEESRKRLSNSRSGIPWSSARILAQQFVKKRNNKI